MESVLFAVCSNPAIKADLNLVGVEQASRGDPLKDDVDVFLGESKATLAAADLALAMDH